MFDQPLTVLVNGQTVALGMLSDEPLVRAVIISLFTWRRANPDDQLPGSELQGWWGDTYVLDSAPAGDRIGSRLWLLARTTITADTPDRAVEYAKEALQWLIDDGIAAAVDVQAERMGLDGVALAVQVTRSTQADDATLNVRFDNLWSFIRAV